MQLSEETTTLLLRLQLLSTTTTTVAPTTTTTVAPTTTTTVAPTTTTTVVNYDYNCCSYYDYNNYSLMVYVLTISTTGKIVGHTELLVVWRTSENYNQDFQPVGSKASEYCFNCYPLEVQVRTRCSV